jgi:hypothetical protein
MWNERGAVKSIRSASLAAASVVLALAAVNSGAAAQFTAAVVPPPPVPKVDTVARADSAKVAAKELQERMTSIKEWVDSAAAALAAQPAHVPPVPPDTARMPRMPALPDTSRARKTPPDTSGSLPRRPPA